MRTINTALGLTPSGDYALHTGQPDKWSARQTLLFIACASGLTWAAIVWACARIL